MIAVLFEVQPTEDGRAAYLAAAATLGARLAEVDGFLSIERFESLSRPGRILSLSFWRDEAAVAAWRNDPSHRATQAAGRDGMFVDYRIRVASVVRDYGQHDRAGAPADSRASLA